MSRVPTIDRGAGAAGSVQRIAGAEHVHFHHKTTDKAAGWGAPLEVEMCCHACHKAVVIRFEMSAVSVQPTPVNSEKIDRDRDAFVREHMSCRPAPGLDFARLCLPRREGDVPVHDYTLRRD